ncbi:MAG: thiamine pyrophosphate-dependent dehydrogenase E1 component subunit alpha [Rhodospirillales bacterium]|nr:thiamine pyrophosphate-dependent dehydrogenase E1 component subunit alpha [Rhodospirillales bacterium]
MRLDAVTFDNLTPEKSLQLHKLMVLIRTTEETLATHYGEQEMRTPVHFGIGQEAAAVGVCAALRQSDVVFSHHRCHNHYLAKGGDLYGLVAELYGKVDGCSKGRGGSVHLTDRSVGLIATSAILGQMVAVASGAALAFKMDGEDRVATSFFGDATIEEGGFYESINYASISKLPVLYVCENNLYSTESPLSVRQPDGTDFCDRVRAFNVTAQSVDGNDVVAVYEAASKAVDQCRNGGGPVFLECKTYRWREHVGPDFDHDHGRTYRSVEELEHWMARCPILQSSERLVQQGLVTTDALKEIEDEAQKAINDCIAKAKKAPWPDASTLFENVS